MHHLEQCVFNISVSDSIFLFKTIILNNQIKIFIDSYSIYFLSSYLKTEQTVVHVHFAGYIRFENVEKN